MEPAIDEEPKKYKRWQPTSGDLLALAVVLLVAITVVYFDRLSSHEYRNNLRVDVAETSALVSTRLAGQIIANVALGQGLASAIATNPAIDEAKFSHLAESMLSSPSAVLAVALARNNRIEMVYPRTGNEAAIGLNYNDQPQQAAAVAHAIDAGTPVVEGPLALVQGGSQLVAYYPLFDGQNSKAWGVMSTIIDFERIRNDNLAFPLKTPLRVSIVRTNPVTQDQELIFGRPEVMTESPVTQPIEFAQRKWTLGAVPALGWQEPLGHSLARRILIGSIAVILVGAVFGIALLMRERLTHFRTLWRRERQLEQLSNRMQLALDASRIGVWEYDLDSGAVVWDERMYALYDISPDETLKDISLWSDSVYPDDVEREQRAFDRVVEGKSSEYHSTFRVVHRDGSLHHIRAFGISNTLKDGTRRMIGANWDVTEDIHRQQALRAANRETKEKNAALERASRGLEYRALHDGLTDLANRRYLEDLISATRSEAALSAPFLLLHIDLDRFKEVNDTLGHEAGDRILRHTARTLKSLARDGEFVARIGGDEFAILSHWDGDAEAAERRARSILAALRRPVDLGVHSCRTGACVGIAWSDPGSSDVLANADIALYEAKKAGRDRYALFNASLRNAAVESRRIADEILAGLDRNEFVVHYQPQVNARTFTLEGVEALVRWHHPSRGLLTPQHFLAAAETVGAISQIDRAVMVQAARQYHSWNSNGIIVPHIAVNISAQRLGDGSIFDGLDTLDLPRGALSFELVESISFDSSDGTFEQVVQRLKHFGIDIEIDDFGTGYASIISLLALAPKRLKIDRQLVTPIVHAQSQRQLISSIVEIGRALGIEIIAEGVETVDHARILCGLGCDILQGYLFAEPLSPADFEHWVTSRNWLALRETLAGT
ncbi:EAL domain-containing protein [Martelella sp. HB161492]|uniref:bifunctional diguanylate cyclase/phosphodiesterase n=1 Tax=Martelella sp. HB161492 TaxID=2720726 RepID=UPI001591BA55|nr:EAL domain-containing protein [Martelella sp. HB161492]